MKLTKKHFWTGILTLLALILAVRYWDQLFGGFRLLLGAMSPIILGAVIAYVINILVAYYERTVAPKCKKPLWVKNRRAVCIALSLLTIVAAAVVLVYAIVPQMTECVVLLAEALPPAMAKSYAWLDEHFSISVLFRDTQVNLPATAADWQAAISKWADVLISGVGGVMNVAVTVTSSVIGKVVTFFLALLLSCQFLAGKERIASQFTRLSRKAFGDRIVKRAVHVMRVLDECFRNYITGQLIEACILGGLCTLGMLIFRFPYAVMIGVLVGVFALIPIAGAYIAAALGAVMIFSQSPVQALWFLIFLIILQQIEGNLIYPRVVGSKLNLPGVWVLAAVTVGGGVFGVIGMIVFVPITAAVYRLLREWVRDVPAELPE